MAILLLIAGSYVFAGDLFVAVRDVAALRADRNVLAAEVERLRTELAVEHATRLELERQAAELNAQVAELNGQMDFLRARRAPANNAE